MVNKRFRQASTDYVSEARTSVSTHCNQISVNGFCKFKDAVLRIDVVKYINSIIFELKTLDKFFEAFSGFIIARKIERRIDPHDMQFCLEEILQQLYFFYKILLVFGVKRVRKHDIFDWSLVKILEN